MSEIKTDEGLAVFSSQKEFEEFEKLHVEGWTYRQDSSPRDYRGANNFETRVNGGWSTKKKEFFMIFRCCCHSFLIFVFRFFWGASTSEHAHRWDWHVLEGKLGWKLGWKGWLKFRL